MKEERTNGFLSAAYCFLLRQHSATSAETALYAR